MTEGYAVQVMEGVDMFWLAHWVRFVVINDFKPLTHERESSTRKEETPHLIY